MIHSSSHLDLTGAAILPDTDESGSHKKAHSPREERGEAPMISLPHQDADTVTHFAIDIGGSLIKVIYFTSSDDGDDAYAKQAGPRLKPTSASGGRLHFVKFETAQLHEAIDFIRSKGLHRQHNGDGTPNGKVARIKATGGGAFKYAELFERELGVRLEREDEMECIVTGANFLLRTVRDEAFTYFDGARRFLDVDVDSDTEPGGLFPYLLVNIGSGVSMLKVTGDGASERVSGSSLGGGTFWGLCRLLTGANDFDEILELSATGDNSKIDMLVGDIYGGLDYAKIGLSASTIASSFGKVVSERNKTLADYAPADMALALMRMLSYNIGQLAYLNAVRYGIKRIFFGGYFIRGHPYTMETISYAIHFWSKGEMQALFLRHEGFMGAMGAFMLGPSLPIQIDALPRPMEKSASASGLVSGQAPDAPGTPTPDARRSEGGTAEVPGPSPALKSVPSDQQLSDGGGGGAEGAKPPGPGALAPRTGAPSGSRRHPGGSSKVRSKFIERFSMGAPLLGGQVRGPAIQNLDEKVSWVEKFASFSSALADPAHPPPAPEPSSGPGSGARAPAALPAPSDLRSLRQPAPAQESGGVHRRVHDPMRGPLQSPSPRMALHVGVLHFEPSLEPFPLLADPDSYEPSTIDIYSDPEEMRYWLNVLDKQTPTLITKAAGSEGGTDDAIRRAHAFGLAFSAHLQRLSQEPGAYGKLGLADLFELREETLREFDFRDAYRLEKERETRVALQVLPDLLAELDRSDAEKRLQDIVQGCLAANIFDWGARSCVQLYEDGQILDIYRQARETQSRRPWRVDTFDSLAEYVLQGKVAGGAGPRPLVRVVTFVDNSGADAVLGMLPFARELLRMGTEVVLACNSRPAINDVTAAEMRDLLATVGACCPLLGAAYRKGLRNRSTSYGGHVPPPPPRDTAAGESEPPALYVVATGHGSPCLDLRRVSRELAEACQGADLVVIEGMGRALHTNLRAKFRCPSLLLAMVKNEHLAKRLFGPEAQLYDCICSFSEGEGGDEMPASPGGDESAPA